MKDVPRDRIIYQKWGYHPHDDVVYLNDDNDYDQNGYAYRIDGGWKLTDIDHNKIDDPYLIKRIIETLGNKSREDSIDHKDYNFTKLHYGQPLPRER